MQPDRDKVQLEFTRKSWSLCIVVEFFYLSTLSHVVCFVIYTSKFVQFMYLPFVVSFHQILPQVLTIYTKHGTAVPLWQSYTCLTDFALFFYHICTCTLISVYTHIHTHTHTFIHNTCMYKYYNRCSCMNWFSLTFLCDVLLCSFVLCGIFHSNI